MASPSSPSAGEEKGGGLGKEAAMRKRKIGILTFSDGRKFAHDLQYKMNKGFHDKLAKTLKATGEVECVPGEIVWTPELARSEAKKLAAAKPSM